MHRAEVIEAVERLDGYQWDGMERFGARDRESDEFCRQRVAQADVFVGIVGHLYGSRPRGSTKSYTVREYDAAVTRRKPRLMFVAPDGFPVPANLRESPAQHKRQQAFRVRVNRDRMRDSSWAPTST